MPRKSQITKKKPLERVTRRSSRISDAVLPNQNPPSDAIPRKTKAAGEVKQQPLVTSKMAENLDRWKVKAAALLPAATPNKNTVNRLAQTRRTRRSLDPSQEKNKGPELPLEAAAAQLPAATSNNSTVNRLAQTRQTRRSLDASKEKNKGLELPVEAAAAQLPAATSNKNKVNRLAQTRQARRSLDLSQEKNKGSELPLEAAAAQLPAATSNNSTVIRLAQTRRTRRSLDASKEKDKSPELPDEASLSSIKAQKRSQSPLPPSVVEGAKKRKIAPPRLLSDTPKPKSLDTKLPVAVAASKSLQAKSLPAKATPTKPKQKNENARKSQNPTVVKGNSIPILRSQSNGQAPTPKKGGSSVADIEEKKQKSLDTKLPVAAAASKPLQAKSLPAEVASKIPKQENGNAMKSQNPCPTPKKGGCSVADIEEPPFEILERCAVAMLGPSGQDKYFLDSLQHFYKRYRDCNSKIDKRLLNLHTSNTQKTLEGEKLKDRLDTKTDKLKDLKERLSQQTELRKKFWKRYMVALTARTTSQKDFESQLQVSKLLTNKQKAELDENQSQVDCLKVELNNIQETNRGMESGIRDIQIQLKQTEETATQLLDQNNKLIATLQERKLEMQEMVAEKESFERQISQLESELKEKILHSTELTRRLVEFQELQLLTDQTARQLELSQNEENSMKTLLAEKETVHISLNERIKELEAIKISFTENNEDYAKLIDAEKAKSSMELKNQRDAYDDVVLKLNSTLNQQLLDLTKLSKSDEDLKEANRHQLALHNEKLNERRMQNIKLEEVNKSLESNLQAQTQNLQAEQRENQELKTATNHIKVLTSEIEGERKSYEAKIAALEAGLVEQDNVSKAQQEKMQSLMAENKELVKSFSNSKHEKEQIANEFAAAKKDCEELKCQAANLENELFGLQEELKKTDTKLIGVEHEKNSIISQLSEKMNFIGSVFEQPITTKTIPSSPKAKKTSKRPQKKMLQELNAEADNIPSSPKKRRSQRTTAFKYVSDFESEDDVPVKLRFSNPRKLGVVKSQGDDLFDALKKATN